MNTVGCSFYCEDHVHFHLFIHSSKNDSFQLSQFMSTSFIEKKISRQTDWFKTVFLAQLSPKFSLAPTRQLDKIQSLSMTLIKTMLSVVVKKHLPVL